MERLMHYTRGRIDSLEEDLKIYKRAKQNAPTMIEERQAQLELTKVESRLNELYHLALEFDLPKPLPF